MLTAISRPSIFPRVSRSLSSSISPARLGRSTRSRRHRPLPLTPYSAGLDETDRPVRRRATFPAHLRDGGDSERAAYVLGHGPDTGSRWIDPARRDSGVLLKRADAPSNRREYDPSEYHAQDSDRYEREPCSGKHPA